MRALYRISLAAFAAVLCFTVTVGSATANQNIKGSSADYHTATGNQIQQDIDDVIRRTPGARQIDPTTILIAPGLTMKLADPNAPTPQDLEAYCSQLYLCVFSNISYNVGTLRGTHLNFTTCGREWDLGRVAFPRGGYWNDKVSSIINNQDGSNATSYFYNYTGHGNDWDKVLDMPPQTHRTNLKIDRVNDIIDGVHVCGPPPSPWKPNYP